MKQTRFKMEWHEFYDRVTKNCNSNMLPIIDKNECYYLYGQTLPETLKSHIKFPPFLINDNNNKYTQNMLKNELNDPCIWISNYKTCSPLHYDLCEGLLYQMSGIKNVCLIKMQYKKSLYSYNVTSIHRRQSQINDIHNCDFNKFPDFQNVPCLQGVIHTVFCCFFIYFSFFFGF